MKIINHSIVGIPYLPKGEGEEGVVVMGVLTEGAVGDYAVYAGIVPLYWRGSRDEYDKDKAEKVARVAAWGQKQSYRKALGFFPFLPEEKYRD